MWRGSTKSPMQQAPHERFIGDRGAKVASGPEQKEKRAESEGACLYKGVWRMRIGRVVAVTTVLHLGG